MRFKKLSAAGLHEGIQRHLAGGKSHQPALPTMTAQAAALVAAQPAWRPPATDEELQALTASLAGYAAKSGMHTVNVPVFLAHYGGRRWETPDGKPITGLNQLQHMLRSWHMRDQLRHGGAPTSAGGGYQHGKAPAHQHVSTHDPETMADEAWRIDAV
jgi:hypothetical protein